MTVSRILAQRSLAALLDLAGDKGVLDQVESGLSAVADLARSDTEFSLLLQSRQTPTTQQKATLDRLLGDRVHPLVSNFVFFMLSKRWGRELPAVIEAHRRSAKWTTAACEVKVTSAGPLPSELEDALRRRLSELAGRPVSLTVRYDRSLLGGIRVQVGDRVIDGSLAGRLRLLSRALSERSISLPAWPAEPAVPGTQPDAAPRTLTAIVKTAMALSPAEEDALHQRLAAMVGGPVQVEVVVDPAILGGVIIQVGDKVFDGSLAGRLGQLGRTLSGRAVSPLPSRAAMRPLPELPPRMLPAVVTTAMPLTPAEEESLRRRLAEVTGAAVQLRVVVDPRLLGGLRVQIGDMMIDGSIAGKLQRMQKSLQARQE